MWRQRLSKPNTSTTTRVIYDGAGRGGRGANYIIYLHTKCNKEVCALVSFFRACVGRRLLTPGRLPFSAVRADTQGGNNPTLTHKKRSVVLHASRPAIWARRSQFTFGGVDALKLSTTNTHTHEHTCRTWWRRRIVTPQPNTHADAGEIRVWYSRDKHKSFFSRPIRK